MFKEKQKRKNANRLPQVLDFSEADLEANSRGLLSDSQHQKLRKQVLSRDTINGAIYGIATAVAFFLLMGSAGHLITFRETGIALGLTVLCVVGAQYAVRILTRPFEEDFGDKKVAVIEGIVMLNASKSPDGELTAYYIEINKVTFNVSERIFHAFQDDEPYRIYFLPRTKFMLSAEWLND